MDRTRVYRIDGLDCAGCAAKVGSSVNNMPQVASAKVDFITKHLTVELKAGASEAIWNEVSHTVSKTAPGASLHMSDHNGNCSSGDCACAQMNQIPFSEKPESGYRIAFSSVPLRIAASLACLVLAQISTHNSLYLALHVLAYVVSGYDILWKALRNSLHGQLFDENFLMSLATVGALAIGEYPEAVAVMLFYQIGEYFQKRAVEKSRKSISALMDIRPDTATVLRDGEFTVSKPESVAVGDILQVKSGERIPLDAIVVSGHSSIDTRALTGETLPQEVGPGDSLISGCMNTSGLLTVRATRIYADSTVARILALVEDSGSHKAKVEQFVTVFARYYTPIVVIAAVLLATVPLLIIPEARFSDWLYRALVFLVISCPCALVISIPLGFFGGIGGAAKLGILVKGGNYLQVLASADTVVFDKTGTLTNGIFSVTSIEVSSGSSYTGETLLDLAASIEKASNHPIARSIVEASPSDLPMATDVKELPGLGLQAFIDGKEILVGNRRLMVDFQVEAHEGGFKHKAGETEVFIAVNKVLAGTIHVADTLKTEAANAVRALKKLGVDKTVMLTGDAKEIAEAVALEAGIDEVHSQLLPQHKVEAVEKLLENQKQHGKLIYVGDGINDAPVLARADIGIAMGALGSDAAIEAADVIIMTDDLSRLPQAIQLSRRTLGIVKQNIVFALGVKAAVLILGAFGLANMWAAVFADTGVALLAVLNSLRILRVSRFKDSSQ
ncbi:MAG: heavy metal translocating P-type ATPase [Sphaerochaetaceae bacterium]